jgi:PKD repeat protein
MGQEHPGRDGKSRRDEAGQGSWRAFHFDGLLLVFLVVGWSLIFATATLGLQRNPQQWLPVKLVPRVAADYGVETREVSHLAPVRPQVIEAVKQDALVARTSTPILDLAAMTPLPTLNPTPTPTSTLTPTPGVPVLAVSAGGPYVGKEGSPISFVAQAASLGLGALTYRWDLDGDGVYDDGEGASVRFVFYDEGEYRIGVQATDRMGRIASATSMVSVSNVAPTVEVGGERYVDEGGEIAFSAQVRDAGHDVLLYDWDFGDGSGASGTLKPRHRYVDNGEYVVHLRADDNDGGVTEAFFTVHVGNLPPVVEAGPDRVADEGATVSFSGAASDPGVLDTLSYAWDLDYDGTNFTPDVLGPVASAVYSDGPAEVVAALRVEDKDGGLGLGTVKVQVNNVAPRIARVSNTSPVGEGSPVTLAVEASDVGSDTLSYAFDWGNDGDFDAVNQPATVSHTWQNQGEYPVGIRVDDGDGGQVFTTTVVTAYNLPPVAVAGSEGVRFEGAPVTFDGSGSSDPGVNDHLSYEWDFGDGSPVVSATTVAHVYADNGVYSATLAVTDDSGASGSDTVAVNILNANPIAGAGDDREVNEGIRLSFDGTATDAGAGDELSYAWDFDYDGEHFDEEAVGASVERTYADGPADYVVALRVRDDDYPYPTDGGGEIGEVIDTLRVTVNNVPPTADAGGPYAGHKGQLITLSGSAGDVPADVPTLTYQWDLNNDGTYDLTGRTVVIAWNTAGVYTVTLRVTDDDGGRGLDTARVTISNAPPTAEAGGPYTGDEGSLITLSGIGFDADGDSLTYIWDLDYNTIFETPGQVVTHTWPDDGVYSITLRVDDGWGGVVTDVATVTVENVAPAADAGPDRAAVEGTPITFSGNAIDPGADTFSFEWDFDYDGSSFDVQASGRTVTTTYFNPGIYTVALRVTDDDDGSGLDTAQVTIGNAPPTAEAGGPYAGEEGSPITLTGTGSDPTNDPLTYAWDLNYDGSFETPGRVVSRAWPDDGEYIVTLRVDDGRGGVATDEARVVVNNVSPIVNAGGPYTATVDIMVTLTGRATDVPSDTLTYAWDLDYDGLFDDGVTPVTTYVWTMTGIYTVALRVDDGDGGVTTDTTRVEVNSLYPFAWLGIPYFLLLVLSKRGFSPRRRKTRN